MTKLYPRQLRPGQHLYPSCIELGTNKPLYVHRRGSNVINGAYYADYNPAYQWMPTFSMRALNLSALQERYDRLLKADRETLAQHSPLKSPVPQIIPAYVSGDVTAAISSSEVMQVLEELQDKSYWEGVFANSNPYIGDGPAEPSPGDFCCTQVGDAYDTSPFRFGEDLKGITTSAYIENMFKLIRFLEQQHVANR